MSGVFKLQSFVLFDEYNVAGETALSSAEMREYESYMRDYKALGNNSVAIAWGVPIDVNTGKRVNSFAMQTAHEASFDEIRQLASYAQSIGLDVILKPQSQTSTVTGTNGDLPNNINDFSVGKYAGFSGATFLSDWTDYMGQVATLAQDIGAKQIIIGTENGGFDLPQYRTQWQGVVSQVRAHYTGSISYDAQYPMQQAAGVDKVGFWDLVDIIGVSAYYPLTNSSNPSYQEVLAGWYANGMFPGNTALKINVIEGLHNLSLQYGKPVELAEYGVQSFHGAVNDPNGSTANNPDWQQQAWMYQSMFEAFSRDNAAGWFLGLNSWGMALAPGQDNPNFSQYVNTYGSTNFDIRAKDAGKIVAAWYGAVNYLAYTDTTWTGSMANDRVALYGNLTAGASKQHQADTFATTVALTVAGNIINGKTPTVHFYINGTDYGAVALDNAAVYTDAKGVSWTAQQTFTFTLPATSSISEVKLAMDTSPYLGGVENSQTFLAAASINGVPLTTLTYSPAGGMPEQQTVGASSQWNGGYSVFDTSTWSDQLSTRSTGTASKPLQVDGSVGTDTVYVLGKASQYAIAYQSDKGSLTLTESSGLNQNAVLKNIEYVNFADGSILSVTDQKFATFVVSGDKDSTQITHKPDGSYSVVDKNGSEILLNNAVRLQLDDTHIALDINGNGGQAYRLYQAAFDRKPDTPGLGWQMKAMDAGVPLVQLAQNFMASDEFKSLYGANLSTTSLVNLLYKNVLHRTPQQFETDFWVNIVDKGLPVKQTPAEVLMSFSESPENQAQVIGSIQNGFEYQYYA